MGYNVVFVSSNLTGARTFMFPVILPGSRGAPRLLQLTHCAGELGSSPALRQHPTSIYMCVCLGFLSMHRFFLYTLCFRDVTGELRYTNLTLDWKTVERNQQADYFRHLDPSARICPLFSVPGFHIGSVMPDPMHDDLIG